MQRSDTKHGASQPEDPEYEATEHNHQVIDHPMLRRIADAWPRRTTIRTDLDTLEEWGGYDPQTPDYPRELLPFAEHPYFEQASEASQQRVLTLAWLVYNERVVAAEEYVANPTFAKIVHGTFPGAESFEVKRAIQQAHIDETFHTYMHMIAMHRTRELRMVGTEPEYPPTITYRKLLEAHAETSEAWERDLLTLVWTTVAEISVNAYLTLLSKAEGIQPMHRLVPQLHARDESAHSSIMIDVVKSLYVHMNTEQRELFVRALPKALHAFVAQDFTAWHGILDHCGVPKPREIIADSQSRSADGLLVRDFSGIKRLARELDISGQLELDKI